jgi:hypothetical protein
MECKIKNIDTPPNPLLIEGELNTYISMTYSPSIKRGLGGVLWIQAIIQLINYITPY